MVGQFVTEAFVTNVLALALAFTLIQIIRTRIRSFQYSDRQIFFPKHYFSRYFFLHYHYWHFAFRIIPCRYFFGLSAKSFV